MSHDAPFAKLVPGFDFLQGLVKNAGQALPGMGGGMGQWVAPTLNPEEIDKRIGELRTVQFWLEQNAKLIGGTIQALEVQRMTLSTLQTMNVQMGDLRDALTARMPSAPPQAAAATAARAPTSAPAPDAAPAAQADAAAPGAIDPMQWWGALTTQFTEIATNALRDSTSEKAQALAGDVVKQSIDAASQALMAAAEPLQSVVRGAATGAATPPAPPARKTPAAQPKRPAPARAAGPAAHAPAAKKKSPARKAPPRKT